MPRKRRNVPVAGAAPPDRHNSLESNQERSLPLLLPAVVNIARDAAAGKAYPLSSVSTLNIRLAEKDRMAVEQWLHSGSLVQLGDVLRRHPLLVRHPAVFQQLQHLHQLAHTPDAAVYEEIDATAPDDAPPAGMQRAAGDALRVLLERLVQGLLAPGWRLIPPGGRPGRKRSTRPYESERLLDEYQDLLSLLTHEEVRPARRGRLPPKDTTAREQALSSVIQRVWEAAETSKDFRTEPTPDAPANIGSLTPMDQLAYTWTVPSVRPLPSEKITALAAEAVELADEGPIRDHIAYALLGHSWGLTKGQVRGRIDTARKRRGVPAQIRPPRRR
jgi:hypothetical protein